MRTSTRWLLALTTLLVLGSLQVAFAAALGEDGSDLAPQADAEELPQDDRDRLVQATFGERPSVAISADSAIDEVSEHYDIAELGAVATPYLETATLGATLIGDGAIRDRAVWIVVLSDFEFEVGGTPPEDGSEVATHLLHRGYVFIDANTGEFLLTEWQE